MSKENNTQCAFKTSIGGQALMEGIMMRGPHRQACVVRKQDGELVIQEKELKFIREKHKIFGWPLIRGVVNFGSSMIEGMRALMFSVDQLPEEELEEPSKLDLWLEEKLGSEKASKIIVGIAAVLGIGLSVGLFILLPTFIAGLFSFTSTPGVLRNLFEGVLRIAIFICYLALVSRMKDMRRMFEYHGAEHKTIFCYEKGLPLTVENVRRQSRFHPRCGTSFLFVVVIVSFLVFMVVRWSNVWVRMGMRLLLLPLVVGISYEINRWVGRHDNRLSAFLSAPGKAMQRLTTGEPDDSMIEVAIKALELVIPENEGEDRW